MALVRAMGRLRSAALDERRRADVPGSVDRGDADQIRGGLAVLQYAGPFDARKNPAPPGTADARLQHPMSNDLRIGWRESNDRLTAESVGHDAHPGFGRWNTVEPGRCRDKRSEEHTSELQSQSNLV